MFQSGMGGQDGIVGLDNSSRDLGSRVDREFKFGFFAIVNRETLHQERGEARSSATTKRVEDEESLKTSALLREFADSVQDKINNFLANGVVTTSIVVGSILKTRNTSF